VKFLADMGISIDTVHWLRDQGHDAIHLHEQGLDQLSDPNIIEKAREEERILLVHDLDFGQLMSLSRSRLPSVITFRLLDMRPESVNQALHEVLQQFSSELEHGALFSIRERRIRVRRLPVFE
jgi:predicted nuclease of predicted toxin-antitoxin system